MLTEKKFRRELVRLLAAGFSATDLNGYASIAVGEACSSYHLSVSNGEVIHSPKGWIYKNAKNKILDEIKRLGHLTRIDYEKKDSYEFRSNENLEQIEEARLMLEEILPLINTKKREALLLHEYENYTLEETAEKLRITVSAVEWRIRQAKSELRKLIKKNK